MISLHSKKCALQGAATESATAVPGDDNDRNNATITAVAGLLSSDAG